MRVGDSIQIDDLGKSGNYRGPVEIVAPQNDGWVEVKILEDHEGSGYKAGDFTDFRVSRIAPADLSTKPTNPKDAVGSDKLPLHLWPETATLTGSLAFLEGALKYGRNNWRDAGVRATIYIDAAKRHINAWAEGEDCAPDSEIPHLGHALACLAILVDAEAAGKLIDDRQFPGGYNALVAELTPHVARLKAKYADKNPRHWTIADGGEHAQT